jgi:Putative transposase, YhgA-like
VIRNEKSLAREKGLPAVLPVVVYTGRPRWRTPLDLASLCPVPHAFEASLPRLSSRLLDVRRLDLDRPDLSESLLATLFRIEASRAPEEIFQRIDNLNRLLPGDGEDELRRDITIWLQGKLQNAFPWVKMIPSVELEGSPMLEENMDIWRRWTERKARRQGEQRGLKRGEVLALKRTLLRLLEQRFGPVPPTVQRGVESMRSVQKLERMVDRVLIARSLHEMGLS